MIKLYYLFLVTFFTILSSINASNYTCDYSFGDQAWNFSKVFYDKEFTILEGQKTWNLVLPQEHGFMISFVCVNITNVNKETTNVSFSSLLHNVKILLAGEAPKEGVPVKILAKRHGY